MKMNFSISEDWNNSLILRYSPDKIVKIGKLLLAKSNNIYKCQNFFDFDINDFEFKELMKLINKNYKIRFSYLNDSMIKKLLNWIKIIVVKLAILIVGKLLYYY